VSRRPAAARTALFLLLALAAAAPARGGEPLGVCLEANLPPWSSHDQSGSGGFDPAVATAVARRLGRETALLWFRAERDEDKSTTLSANALLSDGVCRLVGGYPLIAGALGKPGTAFARLPDYEGAGSDRRRATALGTLVPSRGYQLAALTIVLGPRAAAARIGGLDDLAGRRLGVDAGTLADAVLMLFENGRFADRITHIVPGSGQLLPRLEAGDYDAALVELRRFDAYRARHPDTKLSLSGYYPPVGFNMGFVGLSTEQELIAQVDRAIAEMLHSGELAALARAAGVTYLPPREPNVASDPTFADLGRK
jgi:ABC-type amino acid transport substrate-binding protein